MVIIIFYFDICIKCTFSTIILTMKKYNISLGMSLWWKCYNFYGSIIKRPTDSTSNTTSTTSGKTNGQTSTMRGQTDTTSDRRVLRVDRRMDRRVLRVDKWVLRMGEEYYEQPDKQDRNTLNSTLNIDPSSYLCHVLSWWKSLPTF